MDFKISACLALAVACFAVQGAAVPDAPSVPSAVDVAVKGPFADGLSACIAHHVERTPADDFARVFTRKSPTREWQGEFWGKYMLSAVPLQKWSGSTKIAADIKSSTAIVVASQLDDGYIGNYAPECRAGPGWDVWCCKYVLLGLIAAYDHDGDARTLAAAAKLGDYFIATFGPGRKTLRKTGHFCGLPSCSSLGAFVRLYERTHERRFLDFARYIVAEMDAPDGARLVADALAGVPAAKRAPGGPSDSLASVRKAYEYMSCYQGLVDFARVTGERRYLDAAVRAAEDLLATEIFITGASSCDERWFDGARRQTEPRMGLGETCVITTWLRLCELLHAATGDPKWADAIECAFYNAFRASMRRDASEFTQYTPLMGTRGPGNQHCRLHTNCCNANGPRGYLPILNRLVTADARGVNFNFYASADVTVRTAGGPLGTFEMFTLYPQLNGFPPYWNGTLVRYASETSARFPVRFRIPAWSAKTVVKLNGKELPDVRPGAYFALDRTWRNGDTVELVFDMSVKAHFLNEHVAFTAGPLVLARDARFNDGDIGAPVRFSGAHRIGGRDVAGLFHRVQSPTEDMDVAYAAILPVHLHHGNAFRSLPNVVHFCDYASAANTWNESSSCRTWLPVASDIAGVPNVARAVPTRAGTLMGRMPFRPRTEIARLKDAAGKTVLRVGFDGDKVFRAVFALANGKEATIQRRPSAADDVSSDTFHFALAWGDGGSPRFFVNGLPYLTMTCPGDHARADIGGNLLETVRSMETAGFVHVHDRMLTNAEIVDDFRQFMPVDLVGRDVDHTVSENLSLPFTVAPEGTFTKPDPAPERVHAPSARVTFTAEVAGHPETLTRFDNLLVDRRLDLAVPAASLTSGAHRVVFRFSTGFTYTLRYNVMPPAPKLPEPSLDAWRRVKTIDEVVFDSPAAAPYSNCAVRVAASAAGRYLEADVKSGDRYAWIFRVPADLLGKTCLVDFVWPDDRPRVMGLYAYVSGHGMTCRDRISNGLIAGGIFPNTGRMKTHSVLFWPASTNVLFETRTLVAGRPAALASARISLLAEPLPVLRVRRPDWTRGRTFGHCDEDQTFDVYMNRDFRGPGTEGILRDLIAYLKYTGQDLFQYGCGFRYRYGMSPHWGYREEGHWPVNAGEYPYITRELAKAGIAYSGIVYGGCVPEAEQDDFIGNRGESRGWYLKTARGEERPVMKMLNPGCHELVDVFYSHFSDLLGDCSRKGLSAVRFDINHGMVNVMDRFWSQLAFGAWEGSMWGTCTAAERIDAVTWNVRRFCDMVKAVAPGVEARIGIATSPTLRLDALRSECGIDLDRLAAIDGVHFAVHRPFSTYWFDLFRGSDEPFGQEYNYDARAPEWAAFRKASKGAVAQVAAHNVYIETFEKSLADKEFPCYFQNADVNRTAASS